MRDVIYIIYNASENIVLYPLAKNINETVQILFDDELEVHCFSFVNKQ